jgi:hypothetical protein
LVPALASQHLTDDDLLEVQRLAGNRAAVTLVQRQNVDVDVVSGSDSAAPSAQEVRRGSTPETRRV